jgi:hypothetical protein
MVPMVKNTVAPPFETPAPDLSRGDNDRTIEKKMPHSEEHADNCHKGEFPRSLDDRFQSCLTGVEQRRLLK